MRNNKGIFIKDKYVTDIIYGEIDFDIIKMKKHILIDPEFDVGSLHLTEHDKEQHKQFVLIRVDMK